MAKPGCCVQAALLKKHHLFHHGAGVTGRQRPCAGSVGESLRAQKRARSGGESENSNYNTRRGEYGEAARKPRSARFPQSTRSPVRGEPPQTAARATLWNSARRRAERMRHVRAADRRCTASFRGKPLRSAHRHVRTKQYGFSCGRGTDRAKSRSSTLSIISKPTFGSQGSSGRRNAPRSQYDEILTSRRGKSAVVQTRRKSISRGRSAWRRAGRRRTFCGAWVFRSCRSGCAALRRR